MANTKAFLTCNCDVKGGFERLRAADFPDDQPTKDCVVKTIKRITVRARPVYGHAWPCVAIAVFGTQSVP